MKEYKINLVDGSLTKGRVYLESGEANVYVVPLAYLRRSFNMPCLREGGYFFYEDARGNITLDYARQYYGYAVERQFRTIFIPQGMSSEVFTEHFINGNTNEVGQQIDEMLSMYLNLRKTGMVNFDISDQIIGTVQGIIEEKEAVKPEAKSGPAVSVEPVVMREPVVVNDTEATGVKVEALPTDEADGPANVFDVQFDIDDADVPLKIHSDMNIPNSEPVESDPLVIPGFDTSVFGTITTVKPKEEAPAIKKEPVNWYEEALDDTDSGELSFGGQAFEDILSTLPEEEEEATPPARDRAGGVEQSSDIKKDTDSDYIRSIKLLGKFEPKKKAGVKTGASMDRAPGGPIYYLAVNNQYAEGYDTTDGGFVLQSGSTVRSTINPACPESIINLRKEHANKINASGYLMEDILFNNEKQAGAFVAGGNVGSLTGWHHCNGLSYREVKNNTPTPEIMHIPQDALYTYKKDKESIDACVYYDKEGDSYWVLKGSRVAMSLPYAPKDTVNKFRNVHSGAIDGDGVLNMSVRFTNITTATNFVNGNNTGSASVWRDRAGRRLV